MECPPPPGLRQEVGRGQRGAQGLGAGTPAPSSGFTPPPTPPHTLFPAGAAPAAPSADAGSRRAAHARPRGAGRCAFKARVRRASAGPAAGGASAGRPRGFTCSSERAEQRRGRLRGRRTHRPEGARRRPTWPRSRSGGGDRGGAAGLEARPRRGAGSGRRAPGGRGGEDERGLRRAPRAAGALRRAPGELPPPAPAARKPARRGAVPEAGGARTSPEGLSRASPALAGRSRRALRRSQRLPRSAKPPGQRRAAVPGAVRVRAGGRAGALPRAGPAEHPSAAARSTARRRRGGLPAGGAGAPSIARETRASGVGEPTRAGATGAGTWRQRAGQQGVGDARLGRPCRGPGTRRGAAPVLVFGTPARTGSAGGRRSGAREPLAAEAPRRRRERASGEAPAARSGAGAPGAGRAQGSGVPGARRRPSLLPSEPASGGSGRAARPRRAELRGRRAGCAGGAPEGGAGAARVAGTPPRGRSASLLLPGRAVQPRERTSAAGRAAPGLRARGALGARRGRLQTFPGERASPASVSVELRAGGRGRGAELFPRSDPAPAPSLPGAAGWGPRVLAGRACGELGPGPRPGRAGGSSGGGRCAPPAACEGAPAGCGLRPCCPGCSGTGPRHAPSRAARAAGFPVALAASPASPPPRLTCSSRSRPGARPLHPPECSPRGRSTTSRWAGKPGRSEQEPHRFWSVRGALSLCWAGDGGT